MSEKICYNVVTEEKKPKGKKLLKQKANPKRMVQSNGKVTPERAEQTKEKKFSQTKAAE